MLTPSRGRLGCPLRVPCPTSPLPSEHGAELEAADVHGSELFSKAVRNIEVLNVGFTSLEPLEMPLWKLQSCIYL